MFDRVWLLGMFYSCVFQSKQTFLIRFYGFPSSTIHFRNVYFSKVRCFMWQMPQRVSTNHWRTGGMPREPPKNYFFYTSVLPLEPASSSLSSYTDCAHRWPAKSAMQTYGLEINTIPYAITTKWAPFPNTCIPPTSLLQQSKIHQKVDSSLWGMGESGEKGELQMERKNESGPNSSAPRWEWRVRKGRKSWGKGQEYTINSNKTNCC